MSLFMVGICRCPVSSARSAQKFGGKTKTLDMKKGSGVTATKTLFPHANSRLHLVTLSYLASRNKPIHGLELFQLATVSPALPTRANTLDRCRHFEPGTFIHISLKNGAYSLIYAV